LNRYVYTYDDAGNRTTEQIDDTPTAASYDNMNRLLTMQPDGALRFRGTLNESATVTVQGRPAQVTSDNKFEGPAQVGSGANAVEVRARDYAGNERLNTYQVSVAGSAKTFTYDANGNMRADGTRTLEYDAENRLTRVLIGGAEVARFVYDGLNRRVQKILKAGTTTYVYDAVNAIEERLSTGDTLRYVYGPLVDQLWAVQDATGLVSYYVADHLGSIVQVTNASGEVTLLREYDLHGNLTVGASQGGSAFTGREWDPETGLYYYRARYYDPKMGRFLSEDPIGFEGGINLYAYVGNSPTGWTDPFGFQTNPPPPNINGGKPWTWQADPNNSRGGWFQDELGNRANWDAKYRHWDVDPPNAAGQPGGGTRVRYGAWGNLLPPSAQHKAGGAPPQPLPPSRFKPRGGRGAVGGGVTAACLGILSVISIIIQAIREAEEKKHWLEYCEQNPCDPACYGSGFKCWT